MKFEHLQSLETEVAVPRISLNIPALHKNEIGFREGSTSLKCGNGVG